MTKQTILAMMMMMMGLLAACADDKGEAIDAVARQTPSICPQALIVAQVRTVQNYGGRRPDPSAIVAQARMDSLRGECVAQDDDGQRSIAIDLTLTLVAQRGPRYDGGDVRFAYFVALTDAAEHVVARQQLTAAFDLSETRTARDEETLHVTLPLPARATAETGATYRVLAGFRTGKK